LTSQLDPIPSVARRLRRAKSNHITGGTATGASPHCSMW
jgi:hypothetical protein